MEVAGLVLSAASLASLFSTCLDFYSVLKTVRDLDQAATLQFQLELEESRFRMWGQNIGLTWADDGTVDISKSPRIRLDQWPVIIQTLAQISQICQDMGTLRERYGLDVDRAQELDEQVHATSSKLHKGLLPIKLFRSELGRQKMIAKIIRKDTPVPQRFSWLLKDKESFANLVKRLRLLNDTLREQVEEASRRDLETLCLNIMPRVNEPSQLQAIKESTQGVYDNMALTASHKALRLRLEAEFIERFESGHAHSAPPSSSFLIERSEIYIQENDASRSIGNYKNATVIVEWRKIGSEEYFVGQEPFAQAVQRLNALATLLHVNTPKPEEFRILGCHGYLIDSASRSFALLYEPKISKESIEPLKAAPPSLYDLLDDTSPSRFKPSQTARFLLAQRIASAVLHLHNAGWLHKGIRSSNILMCGNARGDRSSAALVSKLVSEPYLTGLQYSRLSSVVNHSVEVIESAADAQYRHPNLQDSSKRETFKPEHDLYSLGCVFLEIAAWKPLYKLMGSKGTALEKAAKLLRNHIESGDIAHWMGDRFSLTVKTCLEGNWQAVDAESLNLDFYDKIVKQLDQCTV